MEPHLAGVTVRRPMELVALNATFTAQLNLRNVLLEDRWLLRGPMEKVLAVKSGGSEGCVALEIGDAARSRAPRVR